MRQHRLAVSFIVCALLTCGASAASAQTPSQPPTADQARIECLSLCRRILDVTMSELEQQKLRVCVATVPRCLGSGGGALATRDTTPDVMNGYTRPEAMFDMPRAFRRGAGLVEG